MLQGNIHSTTYYIWITHAQVCKYFMYTNLKANLPQFPIQKYVAPHTAILSIIIDAAR